MPSSFWFLVQEREREKAINPPLAHKRVLTGKGGHCYTKVAHKKTPVMDTEFFFPSSGKRAAWYSFVGKIRRGTISSRYLSRPGCWKSTPSREKNGGERDEYTREHGKSKTSYVRK